MKIKFILLLAFLFTISIVNSQKRIKEDKFTEDEFNFVKKTYGWVNEDFMVISYRQSVKKCHYDNYQNLNKANNSFDKLHDKISYKNIKIISVSSDEESIKKYVDNDFIFSDVYDFFSFRVFPNDKSCYCLIVIDSQGNYISKVGEYTDDDINKFLKKLN